MDYLTIALDYLIEKGLLACCQLARRLPARRAPISLLSYIGRDKATLID
jgi:hypothetical protein